MGKQILFGLLAGILVVGVSNAFGEEPQVSDQEILKAWGVQVEVRAVSEVTRQGSQVLTDDDLDQISAAGIAGITNQTSHFALIQPGILLGGVKMVKPELCISACPTQKVYYGAIVDKTVMGGLAKSP